MAEKHFNPSESVRHLLRFPVNRENPDDVMGIDYHRKSAPRVQFLYVIGEVDSEKPVKIGRALSVAFRVRDLQTGNHRRLEVRHAWAGDREDIIRLERSTHAVLRPHKHKAAREWFSVSADDAAWVVEALLGTH